MRKLTDYLDGENIKYNVAEGGAITVGGSLDLRGTGITTLPDNLTVGGYLYLRGSSITALPDNLTVGGNLYLEVTGITTLPDNLTVGGYLYLRGTDIKQPKKEILDHTSSAYSGENFRNVVTGSA